MRPTEYDTDGLPDVYVTVVRVHKYWPALTDGTLVCQVPVGAVVPDDPA